MASDERLLAGLNPEQLEAARCRTHCLAVACPGSGKTKTLAAKAAFLLSDGASTVTAVTFTRDAALELRERIVAIAGDAAKPRLLVGTFHSIDLLMSFPKGRSGFGSAILADMRSPYGDRSWDIVREGERRGYLRRAIAQAGLEIELDEAARLIEDAKAAGKGHGLMDAQREMLETYQRILERNGQVDFQDILLKTNEALFSGAMTPLPVDYLLIDEFQDTDLVQYRWGAHHGAAGSQITAVGDDDQSIYAFRRALGYECMQMFTKEFQASTILLGINYRCRDEILASAGRMVQANLGRIPKLLQAAKGSGGRVEWERFSDFDFEAEACVDAIAAAGTDGASFAVLTRANRRLDLIEAMLVSRQILYRRADGESVLDKPEVALFGAVIDTVATQSARAVDQVLGWAGLSEDNLAQIHQLFGNAIRIGAKQDFETTTLTSDGIATWKDFAKRHQAWSSLNKEGLYHLMLLGIQEWLLLHAKDDRTKRMLEVAAAIYHPAGKSPRERLDELRLARQKKKKDQTGHNAVQVSLMTAHSAKGLEFDRVWILGAEEEAWPSKHGSLEEERRLMYVAMTRAREQLWISAAGKRRTSLFVAESGIERAPEGKYKTSGRPSAAVGEAPSP